MNSPTLSQPNPPTPTPKQIWLEAWWVRRPDGQWSWCAQHFDFRVPCYDKVSNWPTHYLFPGREIIVSFYSYDKMTRDEALSIASAVVLNQNVLNISLKD